MQRVIDKLEYHPNALARGLKSQRSHVIGILAPDIQNPYSAELAGSIQDVMLESGYTAFLSTTEQSSKRELAALAAFFDHRVAGIVVATHRNRSRQRSAGALHAPRLAHRAGGPLTADRPTSTASPPTIGRAHTTPWST